MPVQLRCETNSELAIAALTHHARQTIPQLRRQLVNQIARELLRRIIVRNPVDTGRSRSAWAAALSQLGGTPPAGWRGPHPSSTAINLGAAEGDAQLEHSATRTQITITNAVPYVLLLEVGTSRTAPQYMVHHSLQELRQELHYQPAPLPHPTAE